jgi:DNA-binding LacI/PurR family transcriptional regulator
MNGTIEADFPIDFEDAGDVLNDMSNFEDKFSQVISEIEQLEQAHNLDVTVKSTKDSDNNEYIEVKLQKTA